MHHPPGRNLALPPHRRLVNDLLHFCRQVPNVPMERRMNLAALVMARRIAEPAPGWCALFIKGMALVAARHPELRRAYLSFPRPHLYEHTGNIASRRSGWGSRLTARLRRNEPTRSSGCSLQKRR